MNEGDVEEWRRARFVAWWSWVATRGAKEITSPKDIMELPGDERPKEVKREDYDKVFDYLNRTWTQPLEPG